MDADKSCTFCGRRSRDLLRCSRCKEVYYCSKVCQRGHWREGHREHCKIVGSQAESCAFCGQRSSDLLRCSRCKEVYYCSKDCQKAHWKEGHREDCQIVGSQLCRFCNKSSKQLKGCARCLQAFYCSKECQREDWSQRHREECKAVTPVEKNERLQQATTNRKEGMSEIELYERKSNTNDRKGNSSLDCCSFCGRNGDLKTCTECDKQYYCSRECQKADWKTHKTSCTEEKGRAENNTERSENSSPICAHCRSKSASRVCKDCSVVFYCSKSCQKSHWKKHKSSCKARSGKAKIKETLTVQQCTILGLVSPEENNGLDPNDIHAHESNRGIGKSANVLCCRCKSKRSGLTCPDCNSVTYCSVTCLGQDKDDHKEICKEIQEHRLYQKPSHYPSSITLGMDTSKKEDLWEINHSPSHSTVMFPQDPLCVQDNADLSLVIERSATSCEKAREKIKRQFSSYILITRVREIPIEEISMFDTNICTQPFIFLSYIRRFHGYRGRHNVYLQDSERREIYVSFYLPNDDPSPHFRWSDVVPGKFIAILFPCIHSFLDGSVGLRVDKATNAYIFDVKD